MNNLQDNNFQKYLVNNGWTVECESPLEISNNDGSFATLYAAKVLLSELYEQYKNENCNVEEYPYQKTFNELLKLFNSMEHYIKAVQDKDRENALDGESVLWEKTFNLVFNKNLSYKIKDCFADMNINFRYYDPDTSYKEDVLAYYEAVKQEIDQISSLLTKE